MAKSVVTPGAEIDGFSVGECVHSGGMATLWNVTHPDIAVPLLMKIPRISEGEDPAAIVSFEIAAGGEVTGTKVDAPAFAGTSLPGCVGGMVSHWAFPKSQNGGLAISYPFVFVGG